MLEPMEQLTMNESGYCPFLHETTKECSICMEAFKQGIKVTVLPCDERHYFHSDCILTWSERFRNCPLCKKPYALRDIKKFNKKFVKLAKQAERRRSSILSTSCSLESIQFSEANSEAMMMENDNCADDELS